MTRVVWVLIAALLAAASLVLLLWAGQRRLIYFPFGGAPPHPRDAGLPAASEVVLGTEDGLSLGAWYVEPPSSTGSDWALILFPGNAGNRAFRVPLASRLAALGIRVLMVDYRGYGGNPGTPSEAGLLRDARAARHWLGKRLGQIRQPPRIAYFGESIGTGVAVALALESVPDALILRSPYTSLPDLARFHYPFLPAGLLLRDRFPSIDRVGSLRCPVLVVAAERDSIVPASQSRRIFEAAPLAGRQWLLLPGIDHNDYEALAGDTLIEEVAAFLLRASEVGQPAG